MTKQQRLTFLAVFAALAGCGTPDASMTVNATNSGDGFKAQGIGDPAPPSVQFFKRTSVTARLQDGDATALIIDGKNVVSPDESPTLVTFDARGMSKLATTTPFTQFSTSGRLDFYDRTRKLHFYGKVDYMDGIVSNQILYSGMSGPIARFKKPKAGDLLGALPLQPLAGYKDLDPNKGYRFTLMFDEAMDPDKLHYHLCVFPPAEETDEEAGTLPVYEYDGVSEKGKLNLVLK